MTIEFKMPKLGESVTEGTVGRWLKQPGDALEQYEPMLEVTTDKVDTEVPSPVTGTLVEILVADGDTVPVGTPIARLAEAGAAAAPSAATAFQQREDEPRPVEADRSGFISPAVARVAAEHKVELAQVSGTGRGGRITRQDVERFAAEQRLNPARSNPPTSAAAPIAPATPQPLTAPVVAYQPGMVMGDDLVPLSPMRRAIAEHMVRSKQTAPHVTTVMEADLGAMIAHRQRNKAEFARQDVKLTFTPYFVRAVVAGLHAVPLVNATFTEQGALMHNAVNIGMAVAIPDGLIVPVIQSADEKSLLGLARTVNDLAERARTRRLQADEVTGGTFTITNHGVSGSLFAMPIINQPQSAILGVGAIQKRPVVVSHNGTDAIAIRSMCYLSLTFDHRLIDGVTADQFLSTVVQALQSSPD